MSYVSNEELCAAFIEFTNTINQGSTSATTLTEVAGSNRVLLITVSQGILSTAPIARGDGQVPATMTVGGQSVALAPLAEGNSSDGFNDASAAIFYANEATIAAMTFSAGEANWSITLEGSTDNYVNITAHWLEDFDQTAGIVDSDFAQETTTNNRSVTLTTQADDFVYALGVIRESSSVSTADTARDTGTSGGTGNLHCEFLLSEKVAVGTSTQIVQSFGSGSIAALVGIALRPAGAGGGGRIMGALAGPGGIAGRGGLAGRGGGLAG